MKQIKILGVLAIALTLGLSACGGKPSSGEGEHVHTFDTTVWESNATEHWHPATCEHTKEKGDKAKHTFGEPYDIVAPTCTEAGSQKLKCTVCEYVKTETLKATGHSAQPAEDSADWTVVTEPSCTEVGSKTYVCANCHEAVPVEIPALGHVYEKDADGNDVVVWASRATCTEAGSGSKVCTRCGASEAVTEQALGHVYEKDADGNDVVVWSKEATCEKGGVGEKECTRCHVKETVETDPLGHDLEAVGGATTPTDGTAAVRLYHCKRCDQTYMGFLANEVTNESKSHVRFEPETVAEGEEQGARFLGRPIGNALALDENGTSVRQENGECVYCSTETGDFIEYAFRLNAEQAATLATCRMYVDAKAADYLNGTDFWAYGRSNDEWTPGFYIDGGDERFETNEDGTFKMVKDHARAGFDSQPGAELETEVKLGKRIEDYRYVLYVDDEVKDFDPTTENPTHGSNQNMQREEFVLPYTFHLHEGLNKIKFVMAGGYRSLFYKCIFRPYVEPTPIVVSPESIEVREGKTAQITSSMEGLTYRSSNNSVCTVDANGLVTGVKVGSATITVSKEGNFKDAKVPVTVLEKEGIININLNENYVVNPPKPAEGEEGTPGVDVYYSSYNQSTRLRNFQKDGSITYTFKSEKAGLYNIQLTGSQSGNLADNVSLQVNGADVAISGELKGSTYSAVELVVGQVELPVADDNTIAIKCLVEGSSLTINGIKLFPHEHAWELAAEQPTEGATDAAVVKYVCPSCGMVKYEIAAKTAQMVLASGSAWKTDPTTSSDGAFKLNKDGHSASFTFALPKAFSGKMYQRCYMDSYSSNLNKKMFYQTNNHPCIEVTIGEGEGAAVVDLSQYANTTFKQVLGEELNGSNSLTKDVELGNVTLTTANTISYKRVETLNMLVTHFIFIGREAA